MIPTQTALIHCQAGNLSLALPMNQVTQIMGEAEVRRNGEKGHPHGWINDAGQDVPVIDLAAALGQPPHHSNLPSQYLMLQDQERSLVLLVEKVIRVRRPGSTLFKTLPSPIHHLSHSLLLAAAQEQPTLFLLDFEGLAHLAGLETKPADDWRPFSAPKNPANTPQTAPSMLSFSPSAHPEVMRWALSTTQVAEVLKVDTFEILPTLPSYFSGLLWWREEPVPIIDLNRRIGRQQQTSGERVLIARLVHHAAFIGILCNGNVRLERELDAYRHLELDPQEHPSFALAAFENDEHTVVFPNIDAILA